MDKKQTVFLSAILGIGSIMMLSFLIISTIKANTDCTVDGNLKITGGTLFTFGNAVLGNDTTDEVRAYQYCDENGNNCHDASGGWAGGQIKACSCNGISEEDGIQQAACICTPPACDSGYTNIGTVGGFTYLAFDKNAGELSDYNRNIYRICVK